MYSKRGVMMLAHNVHDVQSFKRHIHANRLNGVDNEWLTPEEAKEYCPPLNIDPDARYPVLGAALQRRGGTARHDAVAWGYARGGRPRWASTSSRIAKSPASAGARTARLRAWKRPRGYIASKKVGVSAAGNTSVVMQMAGLRFAARKLSAAGAGVRSRSSRLPLRGHVEHGACLYEPVGQGRTGDRRGHRSICQLFADAAALHILNHTLAAICEIFPIFRRMRMLRTWGGIVDVTPDRSPILGKTPVQGPLRQLRLGHRRVQGDAGGGP
jgi:sarcosine oxidase subunit beta